MPSRRSPPISRAVALFGVALLLGLGTALSARAEVPSEAPGLVEKLPQPFSPHWVWVADLVLERVALVDLDRGEFLGLVNGGYGTIAPMFSLRRAEIYVPATYYARRTHGERTDVIEIHDAVTLAHSGEIVLPAKRAIDAVVQAHSTLTDDERFAAVFNWTPRTTLSIANMETRTFVGEIGIPGCSLVYAAGARRFLSLCGDGSALVVTVDDEGRESSVVRTEPFFDPVADPVTEKAVRYRDQWLFVSFDGWVHPLDVSGEDVRAAEKWSLFEDADRDASWRIGGRQHLAVHEKSGRLYSLVHQGGADTHKDPGEEVWVYDIEKRRRLQRIRLRNPGLTIYGFPIEVGKDWPWPFRGLPDWLLDTFAPAGISHIQVTRDDRPLLVTGSQFTGSVGVYDARSGEFTKRVQPIGWTGDLLLAPWDGASK